MRIFITGASGTLGEAVAAHLATAGHQVTGLVRTDSAARRLEAAEVRPLRGAMESPASYREVAASCEVLIHCAAEPGERFFDLDRRTVRALLDGATAAGLPRLFIYTSGVWLYGDTGPAMVDEASPLHPPAFLEPRVEVEDEVLAAASDRLRTLVLRPGCVYGGRGSLTSVWFESATRTGAASIVGDGRGPWAMVHLADLAEAYRLAAESSRSGQVFNITDRSRFPVRACAEAASLVAGAGGAVTSLSLTEATRTLGPAAECLAYTQHVSSARAARLLGWQPRHGGFVDGVEQYYLAWRASQTAAG